MPSKLNNIFVSNDEDNEDKLDTNEMKDEEHSNGPMFLGSILTNEVNKDDIDSNSIADNGLFLKGSIETDKVIKNFKIDAYSEVKEVNFVDLKEEMKEEDSRKNVVQKQDNLGKKKVFKCKECTKSYHNSSNLTKHLLKKHEDLKKRTF